MNNKLYVKNDKILFNGFSYKLGDLVTLEFVEYSNSIIDKYYTDCCVVNELYLYYLQHYLALDFFITSQNISEIEAENVAEPLRSYLYDIAKNKGIKLQRKESGYCEIWRWCKSLAVVVASVVYIIWCQVKIKYVGEIFKAQEYALIRYKAAELKLKKFEMRKESEGLTIKDSIYKYVPLTNRIGWAFCSLAGGICLLCQIRKVARDFMGKNSSSLVGTFYEKRVVYTYYYEKLLDFIFKNNPESTYYTTSFVDRISVIEDKMAEKHQIKTICIPHGMEYGFKFPKGYSSSLFYTTSEYSSIFLNKMYHTKKFVFNQDIVYKLFKRDVEPSDVTNKKVVFFSEPAGKDTNYKIVGYLRDKLAKAHIPFYLRLHPAERKDDYNGIGVEILDSFDEAICNNICIARKSTVLIEAIYNGSKSSAILLNGFDKTIFKNFPSLQDKSIAVNTSLDSLYDWVIKNY